MKYKAIGFDYGGVIGGVGSVGPHIEGVINKTLGLDFQTYSKVYFKHNQKIHTGVVPTWKAFWEIVLGELGKPEYLDKMLAINERVEKELKTVDSRMVTLIDTLRSEGYKIGLLSNTPIHNVKYMRQSGLDKHFDVFITSAEAGLIKPDPEIFKMLVNQLQVLPYELVFIDDSEKSLSTAEKCGFKPVLFKSYDQLIKDLKKLRVL